MNKDVEIEKMENDVVLCESLDSEGWVTVVDFGGETMSARELLDVYEREHGNIS